MELTYSDLHDFCDKLNDRGYLRDILTACKLRSLVTNSQGIAEDAMKDVICLGNSIVEKGSIRLEDSPMISYNVMDSENFLLWNLSTMIEPRGLLMLYLITLICKSDLGCPYRVEFIFENAEDRKTFDNMPCSVLEMITRSHSLLMVRSVHRKHLRRVK